MIRILFILGILTMARTATAVEPKALLAARQSYESLPHPSEKQRVTYVTKLVRLRETFTRRDEEELDAIDSEVVKHPMPVSAVTPSLAKRVVGRWQSPRRPYFYHADGTWLSNEDIPGETGGTWHIDGNQLFQNYRGEANVSGETIILLTDTDFIFGSEQLHPYYLRRGDAFPWN